MKMISNKKKKKGFHWKLQSWTEENLDLKSDQPSCFFLRLETWTQNESLVFLCPFQTLLQWYFILKIETHRGSIFIPIVHRALLSAFYNILSSSCPLQWNTSRRCQPSLRAPAPLGLLFPGTHLPPRPRRPLSPRPWRWRSRGSSRWRCARCRGNSALRTRRTGRAC